MICCEFARNFQCVVNKFHSLKILNFCNAVAADCPHFSETYSEAIDGLKLVAYLRPKVIEDVIAIRDKFPCNDLVRNLVKEFVSNFDLLSKWNNE